MRRGEPPKKVIDGAIHQAEQAFGIRPKLLIWYALIAAGCLCWLDLT